MPSTYRKPVSNLSCETIGRLQQQFALRYFVETGTAYGHTAQRAATFFAKVWTVERSLFFCIDAKRRLGQWPHAGRFLADSPRFLAEVKKWCDWPTMFWLDAHWCAPQTAGRDRECPLLEELAALGGLNGKHVVLIDDVTMFTETPPAPHRADHWPRLQDVEAFVDGWPGGCKRRIQDNILEVTP